MMNKSSKSACERVAEFLIDAETDTMLQQYLRDQDKEALLKQMEIFYDLTEQDVRDCLGWTLEAVRPTGWWWW